VVSYYDIFAFHNTCSLPKEQSAYTVALLKEGCLVKCVTSAFCETNDLPLLLYKCVYASNNEPQYTGLCTPNTSVHIYLHTN